MPEKELLKIYSEVVHVINGDDVVKLEDAKIQSSGFRQTQLLAEEWIWSQRDSMKKFMKGVLNEFLESFNNREKETGIYRITLIAENVLKNR